MTKFKAFIRVVKSLNSTSDTDRYLGFDSVTIIKEPLIEAENKEEVKQMLLEKYPQFFQNGKVYEKETKDQAQFFYVVIFPLYNYEVSLIDEGEWVCEYCGQVHENRYISRPIISRKYDGKMFCNDNYDDETQSSASCYEKWKIEINKNVDLPDDMNYVNSSSPNYIYKCTEKSTGKCYIGKTRNAPFFRWWNHLTHSSSPFGLYLRETKLSDWSFEVLEELPSSISDKDIFAIESAYIIRFDSINNGFNSVISNKAVK